MYGTILSKCKKCQEPIKEPKTLPCCGETLCGPCALSIKALDTEPISYKCPVCHQIENMPRKKTFGTNQILLYQMKLYDCQCKIEELERVIKSEGELPIKEHFEKLRELITFTSNERIKQINELKEKFMKRLTNLEEDRLEYFRKNDAKIIKEELKKNDTIKEFHDLEKKWRSSSNQLIESDIVNKIASLEDILSRTEQEKTKIFEMIFNYKRWEFERNLEQIEESFFGKVTIKNSKQGKEPSPKEQQQQSSPRKEGQSARAEGALAQKTAYESRSMHVDSSAAFNSSYNLLGNRDPQITIDWYKWF